MMSTTTEHAKQFVKRIDPHAQFINTYRGISIILRNNAIPKTYFLHRIDDFWYSFGKYYPQIGGAGVSVEHTELLTARTMVNPWIVIAMPKTSDFVFYGLSAIDWLNYCQQNNTFNKHSAAKGAENASIPIKMLINLENEK